MYAGRHHDIDISPRFTEPGEEAGRSTRYARQPISAAARHVRGFEKARRRENSQPAAKEFYMREDADRAALLYAQIAFTRHYISPSVTHLTSRHSAYRAAADVIFTLEPIFQWKMLLTR